MTHLYLCRALRLWMSDLAVGVNAELEGVPVLDGHTRPPPVQVITDPYEDEQCALWREPSAYPALYIVPDGAVEAEGEVATINREMRDVTVSLRYIVERADLSARARDASYVQRAIVRSLRGFFGPAGESARTVGSVYVVSANSITYGRWGEAVGAAYANAVVAVSARLRDRAP